MELNWRELLTMTAEEVEEPGVEQAEIVAIIEAETAAFLKRDVDALCDCWVQESYLQHTTILPYAGVVQVNGIAGLRDHFVSHFRVYEPLEVEAEAIVRKNWQFVVRENMAWVTFEQFGASDAAEHMSGSQMHTRILEKVSGRWKLISSTGVLSRLDFYDCPKIHVDGSAKILHASKESQEVVAIHPVLKISAGRLSATLRKDATKLKNVIQRAQKDIDDGKARLPVPLIFGEESGPDSSLCWVAILDMKIVVLLDDVKLIETTIETAGRIYGLSAMQKRVAAEIAKGEDLTSIANTLEVSTNTVRTHVKRMFDRVGVNNQKTLLNRLLSAQSPAIRLQKQL